MIIRSVAFWAILLAGWLGGGTWYWVCQVHGLCAEASSPPDSPPTSPTAMPLELTYKDLTVMTLPDPLRFAPGQAVPAADPGLAPLLDSLAAYLHAQPERDLEITGGYLPGEAATGGLNPGLDRAAWLAGELAARGIASGRFIKLPRTLAAAPLEGTGWLSLRLLDHTPPPEADTAADARFNGRALYFAFGQSDLELDADSRTYVSEVIRYLRTHPERHLRLTGHTDNVGDPTRNQQIGLDRAGTVRDFFVAFGLEADRIRTASAGDAQPIASNETDEGRSRNRRVEITLE